MIFDLDGMSTIFGLVALFAVAGRQVGQARQLPPISCSGSQWTRAADGVRYFRYFNTIRLNVVDARQTCQQCFGGNLASFGAPDNDPALVQRDIDIFTELLYTVSQQEVEPKAWIDYKNVFARWQHGLTGRQVADAAVVEALQQRCRASAHNTSTSCNTGTDERFLYAMRMFKENSLFHIAGSTLLEEKGYLCERKDLVTTTPYTGTAQPFQLNFKWADYLDGGEGPPTSTVATWSDPFAAKTVLDGRDWDRFKNITVPVAVGILVVIAIFLLACKMQYKEKF